MKKLFVMVASINCPNCNYTVFSRARHDFRTCSCGNVHIDGGFDYIKVGYKDVPTPQVKKKRVYATHQELYDDWNTRTDKFGLYISK
jgi:hypothetical protein